jgi:N-acetylglucosamine-6-phosphate deacetylase
MKNRIESMALSALLLFCILPCFAQQVTEVQGLLYTNNQPVSIVIEDGIIIDIRPFDADAVAELFIVAPGLIDVQVNGYAGVSFTDEGLTVAGVKKATEALWKEGVTSYLPTIITASSATIKSNLQTLKAALEDDQLAQSIPGFFVEGPYISPLDGFRGAHNLEFVRLPNWDEFLDFQAASGNHLIKTTVAPELDGAMEFIERCHQSGVVVAIGHHNGSSAQIHEAAARGAQVSTHLGNGCANMIHRHNNPLWAQLSDDRLIPTIIADGFHLNADEVSVFYKVKGPEKLMLISDVTKLAGLPPGEYDWNGKLVLLTEEGKLRLPEQDVLAGASFSIRKGIRTIMQFTGCSLQEAIQMASTNQSRLFAWNDRGSIEVGKRADLILFKFELGEMIIHQSILGGDRVYEK